MKIQAYKVDVGDAAGYALNLTFTPDDLAHMNEIKECLQNLGASMRQATKEGENTVMSFDVTARDINSFVEHLKTELDTIMSKPAAVTEVPAEQSAEPKEASISGGKVMELIFDKKAFTAIKEKMDQHKFVEPGEKGEKLNFKPTAPAAPTSQKTEKGLGAQFVEQGEKGNLQYPKVERESAVNRFAAETPISSLIDGMAKSYGGYSQIPDEHIGAAICGQENNNHADADKLMADAVSYLTEHWGSNLDDAAIAKMKSDIRAGYESARQRLTSTANRRNNMDRTAAQQLPGSDSINAGEAIEKGEKEKLQFPTKPGPDPKIKMQGLDASSDAKKQIDGGEKGKIQHGQSKGKDIKIDWQVNVDTSIGKQQIEQGDKGDTKKVSGPAKEPGVSAQKESGADANIERGEATKPIQKQFSLNFKRASAEEKEAAVTEAIDNAMLEIEVAASKCGTKLENTRLASVYAGLVSLKEGVRKSGSLYALSAEPKPAAAPIKVRASAKPAVDEDAAAAEVGKRIF